MGKSGKISISVISESDETYKDIKPQNLTRNQKILYTIIHLYIHLTFGLTLSSMSPAFVDFVQILHTEMKWIGLFPTFQAVGTLAGSCATIFYKWINRQITLSILVIGMGLGTIFMPWSTELWHLYLCIFVYGMGIGAWNGANNVILIEMWQKRSPSMLQFSQTIYGVGTILGPILVSKYVIGKMVCPGVWPEECGEESSNTTDIFTTFAPTYECSIECIDYDRRPQLKIPFLIAGLLMMLGPISMMIMVPIKPYYFKNSGKIEVAITEDQKARHKQYVPTKTILICISLTFMFCFMSENMYTDWSATFFQYQPTLHLTAELSAQIFSTMSIALTVGRFLSVFIAMYLKPQYMISYQVFIVFVGYVFQIFGQDQLILLWVSAVMICFGYSSVFICLFSFVGQYMEVTDKIGGLFIGSYNIIYMFLPYFISEEIPKMPSSLLYIEISCESVGIIAFIVAFIAVRNVPKDLIRKLGPVAGH